MAAAIDSAKVAVFEKLFAQPTIEGMLQLTWSEFQDFVQYVFQCAGYMVEFVADKKYPFGPGVDLNLYLSKTATMPVARVEVRRYDPATQLAFNDVAAFLGTLELGGGIPGYLVTTSDFNGPARVAADAAATKVHLINGRHLVRYIKYIGGSRLDGVYTGAKLALSLPTEPNWLAAADDLVSHTPGLHQRPVIIAMANNKGGVGKSTSTRYLGLALAAKGRRILVVDMDPQGNLTEFLLGDSDPATMPQQNLAAYFAGQCSLSTAVCPVPGQPLVSLIPAHPNLGRLDTGGSGRPDVELKFVTDLFETIKPRGAGTSHLCDWVILDTPPAITLFTRAALGAADYVLVPVRARPSSHTGASNMLNVREAMDALLGRDPAILGAFVTHWSDDQTSRLALQRLSDYLNTRDCRMLKTAIPMAVTIEAATHWAAHAISAYDKLVEEVLQYVN